MKSIRNIMFSSIPMLFALVSMMTVSLSAQAVPSFARQTGASCSKCHTASFPRLNATGERFMLNGFVFPKSGEALDVGFGDDEEKSTIGGDDLLLPKDIGQFLSVRGKFLLTDNAEDESKSSLGSPQWFQIFTAGQLAPNVPIWIEWESELKSGKSKVPNYFIGWTNHGEFVLPMI